MFLTIAKVAVGLGFVIFIHELGHFVLAKWNGVRVEKFSSALGQHYLDGGGARPNMCWRHFPSVDLSKC